MKKVIYRFGLLVFLLICCNQEVLANITLNVNAKNSPLANKIYYTDTSVPPSVPPKLLPVILPWKEKVMYGGDGEVTITVNNTLTGDLIIKVDYVEAYSGRAGNMRVISGWLKYDSTGGYFQAAEVVMNGKTAFGSTVIVDKTNLGTLCLVKQLPAKTTLTVFNYITKSIMCGHIIFTAILVDDATAATPQVMGVDVQTVFFNYINTAAVLPQIPIWLDLITSD